MPKRALYEKRPILLASIVAAVAYYALRGAALPELYLVALKGACVGLLAIYAFLRHGNCDARLLMWMLALGAIGDIAIEYDMVAGGLSFFLAHLFAITLFLRHRRVALTGSQRWAVGSLLMLTPIIAWALPADRGAAPGLALYALALGGMAASAWASSFPRYRVGLGAVLFVVSDLLIFSEFGPLANSAIPGLLVWPIYYLAQLLICVGVMQSLRKRAPELRVATSR